MSSSVLKSLLLQSHGETSVYTTCTLLLIQNLAITLHYLDHISIVQNKIYKHKLFIWNKLIKTDTLK